MTETAPERPSSDQRKSMLAQAVASEVARGARVESHTDYQAVLVRGKRVNHVLHLILSLVTLFFWVPVWIILAVVGGEKRTVLGVDDWGHIQKR
jgi:hypothetical protein